jgi:protein TonB
LSASILRLSPGRADPPAEAIDPLAPRTASTRLSVAIGLSVLLHAVVLLIRFQYPDATLFKDPPTIEVVLVNSKSSTRPTKADALAQANLDGGGNTEKRLRAKSNLPAVPDMPADAELALAAKRVQQLEAEARRLLAQLEPGSDVTNPKTMPVEHTKPTDRAKPTDLPDSRLELARLEAEIDREWQAYQELPRRKFIGARTHSVVYAEYVDQWRQEIERVGTANYPDEARQREEFGTVLVTVAIKADGTVEKVEIDRSSGNPVLDAAVERIVMLASPFKAFPANVRRETDILHITRTWAFTRSDLLLQ